MAMPDQMGIEIPDPVKTAITDALNNALNALNALKVVQLTADERGQTLSMSETRFPYAQNAIHVLAPQFPNLQPPFLQLSNATADIDTAVTLREINVLIKEINDRFTDFSLASEHYAFEYMRKFYAIAKEAQAVNTPGADTVVSELGPLFEGQGETGGENPTP